MASKTARPEGRRRGGLRLNLPLLASRVYLLTVEVGLWGFPFFGPRCCPDLCLFGPRGYRAAGSRSLDLRHRDTSRVPRKKQTNATSLQATLGRHGSERRDPVALNPSAKPHLPPPQNHLFN